MHWMFECTGPLGSSCLNVKLTGCNFPIKVREPPKNNLLTVSSSHCRWVLVHLAGLDTQLNYCYCIYGSVTVQESINAVWPGDWSDTVPEIKTQSQLAGSYRWHWTKRRRGRRVRVCDLYARNVSAMALVVVSHWPPLRRLFIDKHELSVTEATPKTITHTLQSEMPREFAEVANMGGWKAFELFRPRNQ